MANQTSLEVGNERSIMGEAIFIISGVGMILKAVAAHVQSEMALGFGAEGEMEKLQDKLDVLQVVLDDAEKRQVKEPLVRYWLEKLKEVAYDAQYVMDDFSYEATRQEMEVPAVPHPLMRLFFDIVLNICSKSNPIQFQVKMAHMIKDINSKFDKIKKEMEEFNFIKTNLSLVSDNSKDVGYHDTTDDGREPNPYSAEVVGREAEKSRLIALLINPDASVGQKGISVLPIVGMGGLGKTTLAELIYYDKQIESYFKDLRMWVHVSQDFDVKKILAEIITKSKDRGKTENNDDSSMETFSCQLRKNLGGKRFLLVLDDVWNEDFEKWDNLRKALLYGAENCKIIVTTRKYEVASLMGTLETFPLKPLSEEDAWSLFKQRAFGNPARSEERKDLAKIGREIVQKCGGVPLALNITGSQLKFKGEDFEGWLFIKNSEIWSQPETNGMMKALMVSYHLLPSHLKQCFSYCSVFGKGEPIEIQTLVQLWTAEGFINVSTSCCNRSERMVLEEDVGRQYVKSLLNNCFFEAEERDEWGDQIISFKMHDLVHDLASLMVSPLDRASIFTDSIEESDAKQLQVISTTSEGASTASRVLEDLINEVDSDNLRVLILKKYFYENLRIENVFPIMNLKRLRVLIMAFCDVEVLPYSIDNLKHLRYLDLSFTEIKELPKTFTALYNLQTLKVFGSKITALPSDFTRKLKNLRHLELTEETEMPKDLNKLQFLQTLPRFKVSRVSKESGLHIQELGPLKHLRGDLHIENLQNVEDKEAAKSVNLTSKPNIRELHLTWSRWDVNDKSVLEGLEPHSNLRALKIGNFMGAKLPTWLNMRVLPNLVEVHLYGLERCETLPAFGSFSLLRILYMREMDSIHRIGSEFYGDAKPSFPSLKKLHIGRFKNLEEWVEAPRSVCSSSSFPVLEELELNYCTNLKAMPTLFPMLRMLEVEKIMGSIMVSLGRSSNLKRLKSLAISQIEGAVKLPPKLLPNYKNLKYLEIVDVAGNESIPAHELQCLTSLEELKIGGDPLPFSLITPQEQLSPSLSVPNEENKEQFLPRLKSLELYNSMIESLPNYLQHFTSIETLKIHLFPYIVELPDWVGKFSSLRKLQFWSCRSLKYFPSALAMRHLTSLKTLDIFRCNELERRCAANGGAEWHKISHIPNII